MAVVFFRKPGKCAESPPALRAGVSCLSCWRLLVKRRDSLGFASLLPPVLFSLAAIKLRGSARAAASVSAGRASNRRAARFRSSNRSRLAQKVPFRPVGLHVFFLPLRR